MKREADATLLLHRLLDRFERATDTSRRIILRASQTFDSAETHRTLDNLLTGARNAGAIEIAFDRDAPHLIDKVILSDADRLYTHLARRPREIGQNAALARLAALKPTTDEGRALSSYLAEQWRSGRKALALTPGNIEQAVRLVDAADAAFTELPGGRVPLRTRSARLLKDSKALERAISKLLAFLRLTGRVDPELTRDEAVHVLGLEKYPQPLLVAGPLLVGGLSVANWTYVGLPNDAADAFGVASTIRSILTVENLESFNRHVRECRDPQDAVVYTGGFPSTGVIAALRRLIELSAIGSICHWGDIDAGGVKIGRYLEKALPVSIKPHLMSAELAVAHGRKASAANLSSSIPPESAFHPLAMFLASPDAHWLEQEVLDPRSVVTAG